MSAYIIGFAVLVFALLAARWFTTRKGLGVTVAALVVCTVLGAMEARLALREHAWSSAVSEMLGFDAAVHCQRMLAYAVDTSPVLGFVRYDVETGIPHHEAYLRRDTCDSLAEFDPAAPTVDQVQALHILTHETMHMSGEKNEAKAECMAVQRDYDMARALGATPEQASELVDLYWPDIHVTLPTQYQSPYCGPGAVWDENLDTSPWNLSPQMQVTVAD